MRKQEKRRLRNLSKEELLKRLNELKRDNTRKARYIGYQLRRRTI